MRTRTVGEVMSDGVVRARPGTSFEELTRLFSTHRISGLPIVDDDGKVVGVVSRTDLTRRRAARPARTRTTMAGVLARWGRRARGDRSSPYAPTAGTLMTTPAVTVHPEQRVADAARVMQRCRVDRLPVVDEEDRLIGIATRRDLLGVFLRTDDDVLRDVTHAVRTLVPLPVRDGVRVRVRDGVVRLEFPAREDIDATALTRAAWRVDGVVGVVHGSTATPARSPGA
ncbi:CBS domain-containing protein [Streptomyces roseolilacinus]|uniref:CBS domain-containing protein n=1 Tax=Streptomyces roseolilacinus TaxID=66904 RepID=UPI001676DB39|nr:CBS domain-containing protein [Streptomyces roseolilacinus]